MEFILTVYSCLFMHFALTVKPRNYLLFTCHFLNAVLQFNLLTKRLGYEYDRWSRGLPIDGPTEMDLGHAASMATVQKVLAERAAKKSELEVAGNDKESLE